MLFSISFVFSLACRFWFGTYINRIGSLDFRASIFFSFHHSLSLQLWNFDYYFFFIRLQFVCFFFRLTFPSETSPLAKHWNHKTRFMRECADVVLMRCHCFRITYLYFIVHFIWCLWVLRIHLSIDYSMLKLLLYLYICIQLRLWILHIKYFVFIQIKSKEWIKVTLRLKHFVRERKKEKSDLIISKNDPEIKRISSNFLICAC